MTLKGKVVSGKRLGRTIGFPTANLDITEGVDVGVYAVRILFCDAWYNGMMNVGTASQIYGASTGDGIIVEVNIFDFDEDIYGSELKIEIVGRIRDEKKFNSVEELKVQLQADKERAMEILNAAAFCSIPNPCYVLQEELLEKNLSIIDDVRKRAGVEFIVALKAFAFWKAFPIFKRYGFNKATASSPWEAQLVYEEFGTPAHVFSPCYTDENISDFVKYGSHITFNSLQQFERFTSQIKELSAGLRVNPEYSEVTTELYNPTGKGSRLGIKKEDMPAQLPPQIEGLHCHTLCESSAEASAKLIAAFEEKFSQYLSNLKWVNFGGGHLVTRKDYNTETLVNALKEFKQRHPHLTVYLEPGSAFTWQTGYLLARVEDIVENSGIKTAILNISFSCHLPDCLEMPYMPAVRGAKIVENDSEGENIYRLGGNSCLAGDFMGSWQFDHELKIGEEIIFEDMIHYTLVKTTTFNGLKHPSIAITKNGIITYLRNFTFADYKP
ncbi:MAG: carboxynorspermidine decarboxylase, partial [Bacteroidales bacterium]|nr:carboxynorspermidine decarboxylase [Bacteroidales bacterium]